MLLRIYNIIEKNKYESQKIDAIKNWLKFKTVYNIHVFLNFANFYWQFISSFNRIVTPLILILKITRLPNESAFSKNNGNKPAPSKNDSNKLVSRKNNSNNEINRFGDNSVEYTKKLKNLKD